MSLSKSLGLLHSLSDQGRQIVSFWRAKLFFQQDSPFIANETVKKRLDTLFKEKLILPIKGGKGRLWQANTPYLHQSNNIYELANEAYPIGSLSYSSALEIMQLTDQRFKKVHLFIPRESVLNIFERGEDFRNNIMPPDTSLDDWQINEVPRNTTIKKTVWETYSLAPHKIKPEWIFGTEIQEIQGVKVRITSLERTLIDGLKNPKYCGGLNEVFKAWVRALDDINIDKLVDFTEKYDRSILYQRVGFVCKMLGRDHSRFDYWKENKAPRGGSRVLNPYKEFKTNYDPEWNISINHPTSILKNKDADYS
jgi:predicted transcriptional regulator of viral defense system